MVRPKIRLLSEVPIRSLIKRFTRYMPEDGVDVVEAQCSSKSLEGTWMTCKTVQSPQNGLHAERTLFKLLQKQETTEKDCH